MITFDDSFAHFIFQIEQVKKQKQDEEPTTPEIPNITVTDTSGSLQIKNGGDCQDPEDPLAALSQQTDGGSCYDTEGR